MKRKQLIQKQNDIKEHRFNCLQSETIDFLRFPLAVMVVFIHVYSSVPNDVNWIDADFDFWSWHGFYNLFVILFSNTLPEIAVPAFFCISGYLFFINIQNWDWNKYFAKLKNRIKTLLIPYMMWNLVPFFLMILSLLMSVWLKGRPMDDVSLFINRHSWHIFYDCHIWGEKWINWLGNPLRMTGPYDAPLWFLRDLMVVTILSPIVFWIIKRLKIFGIIALFVAYISRIWISIPGFDISAWFFFSVGAYFAINKINIIRWASKYAIIFVPLSIVLLSASVVYDGLSTVVGQNIIPLYVCVGVPSVFYLACLCISKLRMKPNKFLVSGCFFIYAFHAVELPVVGSPIHCVSRLIAGCLQKISGEEILSYAGQSTVFFVSPFVTIIVSLLLLEIARRLFPKLTLLFSGNK